MYRFLTALCLLLPLSPVYASCLPNWAYIGPEVYHLRREREGGTHQSGWISGVRLGYDRIKRYRFYYGFDFLHAEGHLSGATATGRKLSSELTDEIFELRLGYTLQQRDKRRSFIVPYIGYGHFREKNHFYNPSPLPCTFIDSFNYVAGGFLSGLYIHPLLRIGLNFKLRFMQDGTSEVKDDPVYDDITLEMEDEIQVRVEVPLVLDLPRARRSIGLIVTPFYEYRHFGGREGFPFNFKDTQFYLWGTHFALCYRF